MIKFEFTVSDVDAENILDCIRSTACRNDIHIMDYMCRTDITEEQKASYISHLKRNKAYLLGLINKMNNVFVEE